MPGSTTPALIVGRWIYHDDTTPASDGTFVQFATSPEYGKVESQFLWQGEPITESAMDCTLTTDGIIIEETCEEICNRYEGILSEDRNAISGTWTCTKSTMTGDDATKEGDFGKFGLQRDTKDCLPFAEAVKLFTGRWVYKDQYTEEEDGTIVEIHLDDKTSKMMACFLFDDALPCACELTKNGKGITIEERGEDISNDYEGFLSSDGHTINGWWTTIESKDESAGDSGEFKLTKDVGDD